MTIAQMSRRQETLRTLASSMKTPAWTAWYAFPLSRRSMPGTGSDPNSGKVDSSHKEP
jgi:hypothetical protein